MACELSISFVTFPCGTEYTNNSLNIQVDLLLGKAYSDWGHISDAVAVYDQLISSHPNDFRGYLAKVNQKIISIKVTRAFMNTPSSYERIVYDMS